jgi:hypothetical protein
MVCRRTRPGEDKRLTLFDPIPSGVQQFYVRGANRFCGGVSAEGFTIYGSPWWRSAASDARARPADADPAARTDQHTVPTLQPFESITPRGVSQPRRRQRCFCNRRAYGAS